jgi:putative transcriptional regulator
MRKGKPVPENRSAERPDPALSTGPRSHFGEALILEHTVGAASRGAALAVACHLALCPSCRELAEDLERIGDALVDGSAPAPAADLLARIIASTDSRSQLPAPVRELPAALQGTLPSVPRALVSVLATLSRPRWRWLAPGLRGITLHESEDGAVARLLQLRPGVVIPGHDHGGDEHTVIFAGGLDDERIRLDRGDALTMTPGEQHRQRAAAGAACVALIVNEAPPRPLTLGGRILKRIARL